MEIIRINFVVTMESIIPNLGILKEYKPLMKQFLVMAFLITWICAILAFDKSKDLENEIN